MALKAAFGMHKMMWAAFQLLPRAAAQASPVWPSATISIHTGPVHLVHIDDPLHGGGGFMTAAGGAVLAVSALNHNARACGWKTSASLAVLTGMSELASPGRRALVPAGPADAALNAVEVLQKAAA